MKRIFALALAAVSLTALVLVVACGGTRAARQDTYGKAIPAGMTVTKAADIVNNPTAWEGKDVLVQGKIASECPSGGWIWLQDESGRVYVNMHPTNIFIPQRVGKEVKVTGKVVVEDGASQIIGYGLEF